MPPVAHNPPAKLVAPRRADRSTGPLEASGVDVVGAETVVLCSADADGLPSSVVVDIDDLHCPRVVVAEIEDQWVGWLAVRARACRFGPVHEGGGSCGLVGPEDGIAEAWMVLASLLECCLC